MTETTITHVTHRTVYDSRGVETLEVDVRTAAGSATVAASFGAPGSRGEFEAPAYAPQGVEASRRILDREIVPALVGMDAAAQEEVDELLTAIDGTANFERIGGNTAAVLSTAVAKAAADALHVPLFALLGDDVEERRLPFPLGNIIGGGAHSLGPAPDMQEHLALPVGARTLREAIATNIEVHEHAGALLEKKDPSFVGGTDDENAWVANLDDTDALEILQRAAHAVSEKRQVEIRLGLDLAADRLWDGAKGKYDYHREGITRTPEEQFAFLCELADRFDLAYIEDAFHSNDYESFAHLRERVGENCLVCADDLYASNTERTRHGLSLAAADAMIIKPNQVGTLTAAKRTAIFARDAGMRIVLSHRSGETVDDSIAHLAVAWRALMIKTGVKGGERLAKLNELLRIEESQHLALADASLFPPI